MCAVHEENGDIGGVLAVLYELSHILGKRTLISVTRWMDRPCDKQDAAGIRVNNNNALADSCRNNRAQDKSVACSWKLLADDDVAHKKTTSSATHQPHFLPFYLLCFEIRLNAAQMSALSGGLGCACYYMVPAVVYATQQRHTAFLAFQIVFSYIYG